MNNFNIIIFNDMMMKSACNDMRNLHKSLRNRKLHNVNVLGIQKSQGCVVYAMQETGFALQQLAYDLEDLTQVTEEALNNSITIMKTADQGLADALKRK